MPSLLQPHLTTHSPAGHPRTPVSPLGTPSLLQPYRITHIHTPVSPLSTPSPPPYPHT